jgi:hypothetical protein
MLCLPSFGHRAAGHRRFEKARAFAPAGAVWQGGAALTRHPGPGPAPRAPPRRLVHVPRGSRQENNGSACPWSKVTRERGLLYVAAGWLVSSVLDVGSARVARGVTRTLPARVTAVFLRRARKRRVKPVRTGPAARFPSSRVVGSARVACGASHAAPVCETAAPNPSVPCRFSSLKRGPDTDPGCTVYIRVGISLAHQRACEGPIRG